MFCKLALLALVTPLVSALTLHIPEDPRNSQEVTITWDHAPGDPETFTLELMNEEFNDSFAIANNIDVNQGSITVTLPVVPVRGGYTLEAVNIGNVDEVYSSTGSFAIGETESSASSGSSTRASTTGTGTGSSTGTGTSTRNSTSSTSTTHSGTASTTPTSTNTSPANPAAATNLNGASSFQVNAAVAAMAGVAGAIAFAL